MSTTEDSMSSETTGEQQPPERPETNDAIDAERDAAHEPLSSITMAPGDRVAGPDSVDMLVIEAELACLEGKELDNPATPMTAAVGEELFERLDDHDEDLVPAWTRPWEGNDE
jgi:hypothetical protein